jgi:hypothetical protein
VEMALWDWVGARVPGGMTHTHTHTDIYIYIFDLDQDRDQWRALVNKVMNLRVP